MPFKLTTTHLRIITHYITTLRLIKLNFKLLNLKGKRPEKVILRDLPINTSTSFIFEELISTNFKPVSVVQPKHRTTTTTKINSDISCLFQNLLLTLTKCLISLKLIIFILKLKIKSPPIKQYYHCQYFGRSSNTCTLFPRCVRFGESHFTSECKNSSEKPKCANCGGPNPANNYYRCL